MNKIDLKPIFAINSNAIVYFIARNSVRNWNDSSNVFNKNTIISNIY